MRWLASGSVEAVAEAVRAVAPELSTLPITPRGAPVQDDPQWWSSSARLGADLVVKYAWSRPAAARLVNEIGVLGALAGSPVPYLPEVVVAGVEPVLLITRWVDGSSLFEVVDAIDRDRAGAQLARFLAALHDAETLALLNRAGLARHPPDPPPAPTAALCERVPGHVRPDQRARVRRWCEWAGRVLAAPGDAVVVHGDLHGDNQVWVGDRLDRVLDFETVGRAEPEYDLRALPGTGPGVELLPVTVRHYESRSGRRLDLTRVMAWHVRAALGDVLWRGEAGLALPDHRTPPEWVDDIAARFAQLGIAAEKS